MSTVEKVLPRDEDRIVLVGISWELYEQLRENEDNWHVRMAYDDGALELMSPSPDHEAIKKLIGQLIEAFTAEMGISRRSLDQQLGSVASLVRDAKPTNVTTFSITTASESGGLSILPLIRHRI